MAEFGLYLPQIGLSFGQIVEAASRAWSLGFRHVWFIDHFEVPGCGAVLEGWTTSTAVASRVPGIRIGHLVLCAPTRHPALLARMAATLDVVSEGRLDLGLGWGGARRELSAYGVNADPGRVRRAKLVEVIAIVRLMLAGGSVAFEGQHYTVREESPGLAAVQSPVPVFVGGGGAATMGIVRDHADWWNCPSYAWPALPELLALRGRARVSANYSVAIDERSEGPAQLSGKRNAPVLCGSSRALAHVLARDRGLGVELFNIQFVQLEHLGQHMERFMREVAPRVR